MQLQLGKCADAKDVLQFQKPTGRRCPIGLTDIAYVRTHEGWLYLAVVVDLFSRQTVGWAMRPLDHPSIAPQPRLLQLPQDDCRSPSRPADRIGSRAAGRAIGQRIHR